MAPELRRLQNHHHDRRVRRDQRLHWRDAHTLVVSCDAARIFAFSNFWQSAAVDNFHYTVALELDGCRYPAAPDKDKS